MMRYVHLHSDRFILAWSPAADQSIVNLQKLQYSPNKP